MYIVIQVILKEKVLLIYWSKYGGGGGGMTPPPSPLATQLPTALQGGKGVKVTYFIVS